MNIADIERFVDDFNKPHRKHSRKRSWLALGSIIVAFMIGTMLVLPIFDRKSLLSHLQTYLEGDIDKIVSVADEPGENSTLPAYDYWYAPENSFGIKETKTVNWSYFKQLFLAHTDWMMEYKHFEWSEWTVAPGEYWGFERTWNDSGFWKIDLWLDVPVDLYSARFTMGIDLPCLQYVERSGYEVWINYTANATEIYSVMFNWSDIASIPNLVITKGIQDGMFWFRFRCDDIPAGHYEFDPTFGNNLVYTYNLYIENVIGAGKFQMGAVGGEADNITALVTVSYLTRDMMCALYDSSSNLIANGETEERNIGVSSTWQTFNFVGTKPTLVADALYYICVWSSDDTASVPLKYDHANGSGVFNDAEIYDGSYPASATFATTDADGRACLYCSYTEGGANNAPTLSGEIPANTSTGISLTPECNITANDADGGDTLNVSFYENTTGYFKLQQTNSSVAPGTIVRWTYTNATTASTKYWWAVNSTDGTDYVNETYSFTTAANATWQQSWTSNFSFSNTTYNLVQQWTSNFSFSNSTYDLTQQWNSNFSFSNTSRLQQQWTSNMSFSNSTYNLEQQWNSNFSFSNSTFSPIQQWTSNFSFSNSSMTLTQQWTSNFSFSNSTYSLTQQWTSNMSFSNSTFSPVQQWTSNFSFSNGTIYTWQQTWNSNFSFSNTSKILTQIWTSNFSFSNSTAYWTERPEDGSQLTTELTQLCININDPQGDNMYWEIWQGGNLLENGTPFTYPTHTYTFNNCTTPHSAYWSSDNVPLKMTGDVEFSCSNYTNVSAVDLLNVTTNAASKDYTHHHFLFNITEDPSTITNVDVNWHGYAGAYVGGAKPKWYWDATMYFNTDAPGWYTADSTTLYTTDTPHEEWLNYTLHHDINDWLDDNGILEIAIQNTYAGQPSIVHTDYIEVVVTYRTGGDPNGSYCTSNVSFWNNVTCEQWWTWNISIYDGTSTTYETYTFQNMPCVLSAYIYPMNQTTGICPCCDAICFSVGGLYGNINATVYRRGEYEPSFYMIENYTNISNGIYCFCLDGHIDGGMYRPMRFNTTYYWYVYAENYYNTSMNVTSGIFHFTTAEDAAECVDTGTGETVFITWNTQSAVGLMGLAGLICIPILLKKRKKKEDEL